MLGGIILCVPFFPFLPFPLSLRTFLPYPLVSSSSSSRSQLGMFNFASHPHLLVKLPVLTTFFC